jgi:hypothetical protein
MTAPIVIDYALAEMLLSNAIAEKGEDFVYTPAEFTREIDDSYWLDESEADELITSVTEAECAYFDEDGSPSCGVGCALAQVGVTADMVEPWNICVGVDTLANHLTYNNINLTPKAVKLLATFQSYQDQGNPWGVAWDHAVDAVNDQEQTYGKIENGEN